jgi:exonuclease VII small subunit
MTNKYAVFFEKENEELNEIVRNLNNDNIED